METTYFEWTVKDDNDDEHIVKIGREGRNRYIYLDDAKIETIPNDFHHSKLFNYQYEFKLLGKNAKITYRIGKSPGHFSLHINGQNVIETGYRDCYTPKMPIYGIISLAVGWLLSIFIEIQIIKQKDPAYLLWAVCPYPPLFYLRKFSNIPLVVGLPKLGAHIGRIIMQAVCISFLVFILWVVNHG